MRKQVEHSFMTWQDGVLRSSDSNRAKADALSSEIAKRQKDGWEVCGCVPWDRGFTLVFKRTRTVECKHDVKAGAWVTGTFTFDSMAQYIDVCPCGAVRCWARSEEEDDWVHTSWQKPPWAREEEKRADEEA